MRRFRGGGLWISGGRQIGHRNDRPSGVGVAGQIAEVDMSFVYAARGDDEPVPVGNRWRQGKHSKRTRFNVLRLNELLKAREGRIMREMGCANIKDREHQAGKIPRGVLETESKMSQRWQEK